MSASSTQVRRAYVTVGDLQVHYRRAGAGAALVLLHESPLSSAALGGLIAALATRFTVLALDTPGYGGSDPLPPSSPRIEDYADAVADTLTALRIERCGLYGAYTGAAIALEVARRHPGRVAAAVLDGLPLFDDAEADELLARYNPPFPPCDDGAHLVSIWHRYRSQFLYFPWYRREAAARRLADMPAPRDLHAGVMDILRAGAGRGDGGAYGTSYAAVFRHRAAGALAELSVPTTVLVREHDVIGEQLSRLPALPPTVTLRPVGAGGGPGVHHLADAAQQQVAAAVAAVLGEHPEIAEAPPAPAPAPIAGRITKDYAMTGHGQLLVRRAGEAGAHGVSPLVMLHASPGSAQMLVGLIERLASGGRRVLALDTLGNGDSDKPPWEDAEIADYAAVVLEATDALGLARFDLYGSHTGALIASEAALLAPERVRRLVMDGVTIFDADQTADLLANYTPPLSPRDDGTHLLAAWHFLRDQTLYWPWYNRTWEGVRSTEPIGAQALAVWLLELLKSGHTYPLAYRAAFRHPTRERMPLLHTPTLMAASAGDMLHATTAQAAELAPNARFATLPDDTDGAAAVLAAFLDAAD